MGSSQSAQNIRRVHKERRRLEDQAAKNAELARKASKNAARVPDSVVQTEPEENQRVAGTSTAGGPTSSGTTRDVATQTGSGLCLAPRSSPHGAIPRTLAVQAVSPNSVRKLPHTPRGVVFMDYPKHPKNPFTEKESNLILGIGSPRPCRYRPRGTQDPINDRVGTSSEKIQICEMCGNRCLKKIIHE